MYTIYIYIIYIYYIIYYICFFLNTNSWDPRTSAPRGHAAQQPDPSVLLQEVWVDGHMKKGKNGENV